jgi:thiol:disulfide interchange protein DsbA
VLKERYFERSADFLLWGLKIARRERFRKGELSLGAALIAIVKRSGRGLGVLVARAGLLLFLLIVTGATVPVSAADPSLPAFGGGAVEVRVYTDYFCGPCRAEEQEVMVAIEELVARNHIRVIFIDTPLYPETVLYAGYFLAAVNAKREFGQATAARTALFEAAGLQIREKGELETFLKKKGVEILPFDTAPVFKIFSNYIKEDRINSTPTVVISGPGGKQILGNKEQILKALSGLRR